MTQNQVAYWNLQETQRANMASEAIKQFANRETARSNRANEGIKGRTLDETRRSNLAQEALKARQLTEEERHNLRSEKIQETSAITGGIRDVSSALFGKSGLFGFKI